MKDNYIDLWGIKIPDIYFTWAVWLGVGLFVAWIITSSFNIGYKEIGHWFEKGEYETQYWVYLQPDNVEFKNYRVKGDIDHTEGTYYLSRVYWANGGYSDFNDCDLDETINSKNGYAKCWDSGAKTYYHIRIAEKVK